MAKKISTIQRIRAARRAWKVGRIDDLSKLITNIQVTGGLASFDFMGGGPSSIQAPVSTSSLQVLYDIGPVRIVRMPNGEIKKVMKR